MGKDRAGELRLPLQRDGCVELGISTWKVALHALFFTGLTAILLGVAVAWGPLWGIIPILAAVLVLYLGVPPLVEMVGGTGPALRIDRDGVTLRRWRQPLRIAWGDLFLAVPFRDSRLTGPALGLVLPPTVWADYRTTRTGRLRSLDRSAPFPGGMRILVPHKVLTCSARTLVELLEHGTVASMTRLPERDLRLVLVPEDHITSGLVHRSGREIPEATLGLGAATRDALRAWRMSAATTLADWEGVASRDGEAAAYVFLEKHAAESRQLAARLSRELGAGTEVAVWLESDDYTAFVSAFDEA